jgi:hypothetical protein
MGIFNRTTQKAMISEQPKKAAAAGAMMPATNNSGAGHGWCLLFLFRGQSETNCYEPAHDQPRSRLALHHNQLHEFADV